LGSCKPFTVSKKNSLVLPGKINGENCLQDIDNVASEGLDKESKEVKQERLWSDEFEAAGKPDVTKWNYDLGHGCPTAFG